MFFAWLFRLSDLLRHRARLRTWNASRAWGRRGEDLAHRHLRKQGLRIIARNFRTRAGTAEVDLIAREGNLVVFVEVKSRETADFGSPERAVDSEKREHLIRAASEYVRRTDCGWDSIRFDVVSVVFQPRPSIQHRRGAFSAAAR